MRLRTLLAANLRILREERGWSQEELAHRAGVDRNYPGNLERQENSATLDMVEQLADALGVPALRLLDEAALAHDLAPAPQ